jgi:predicted enzyme related to lactoylglutathione lyase
MTIRDSYPPGVPCWVERLIPDVEGAKSFYSGVFGWEFVGPGPMPGDPPGQYFIARLGGLDVAGIGTRPAGAADGAPAWTTHVAVASADDAAATAEAAGGEILVGPFDVPPAGRLAVLQDPSGATFCVWQAGQREGAQLVNEPGAWAMSLLSTGDPESARAFYGRLFGWEAEPFDAGPGAEVWLWRRPGYLGGKPEQPVPRDVVAAMMRSPDEAGAGAPSNWGVDFWTADADAAAAAAPVLGGRVVAPPSEAAGFSRTILADPDGAVLSVSQLRL